MSAFRESFTEDSSGNLCTFLIFNNGKDPSFHLNSQTGSRGGRRDLDAFLCDAIRRASVIIP